MPEHVPQPSPMMIVNKWVNKFKNKLLATFFFPCNNWVGEKGALPLLHISLQINVLFIHNGRPKSFINVPVVFSCQLHKAQSQLKNHQDQINLWTCLWGIFFIVNWCRRVQPTVGGTIPKQVFLGCIRAWASEQASTQCSFMIIASVSRLEFMPWLPSVSVDCELGV